MHGVEEENGEYGLCFAIPKLTLGRSPVLQLLCSVTTPFGRPVVPLV